MKKIKIQFANFWDGFKPEHYFFYQQLQRLYEVEITTQADYFISSCFGTQMPSHPCTKIFITAENVPPRPEDFDWNFSFSYDEDINDPRHMRLPNYFNTRTGETLVKPDGWAEETRKQKTKFCNFIYYNSRAPKRNAFFNQLSRYAHIDAPGRSKNNMPPIGAGSAHESRFTNEMLERQAHISLRYRNKVDFMRPYKFAITFENSHAPGYTTEKIVHAMEAGCIPVYWGNPLVMRDFNTQSFVNYYDYEKALLEESPWLRIIPPILQQKTFQRMIKHIMEMDRNDDAYTAILRQPWFHQNIPNIYLNEERFTQRLKDIFG
jgi:hypothetical protein